MNQRTSSLLRPAGEKKEGLAGAGDEQSQRAPGEKQFC